jgi:hypothetical protein
MANFINHILCELAGARKNQDFSTISLEMGHRIWYKNIGKLHTRKLNLFILYWQLILGLLKEGGNIKP